MKAFKHLLRDIKKWKLIQLPGISNYQKQSCFKGSNELLSAGCKYLRKATNACCLFDMIHLYQFHPVTKEYPIQVWDIRKIDQHRFSCLN